MKHSVVNVISAAVGSVIVTLLTGLLNSTPGGGFVGASWYGYPMTWLRKLVIAPQYNPWVIDWTGLVVDLVFWFIVVAVIELIVAKVSKPQRAKKAGKK